MNALLELGAVPQLGFAVVGDDGDEKVLVGFVRSFLEIDAHAGALVAVADVVSGGLEVALLHQFLLDHVLDVLDVDEGLVAGAHALGDGGGDVIGRLRDFVDGEESFSNRDLDLGLAPRHDVAIATDQADGQGVRLGSGRDAATPLDRAAEGEGLGDVVGVVLEQGLLDEQVEVTFRKAQAATFVEGLGERVGDRVGDVRDELAVLLGEDAVLLQLAGDEQVGE